MCAKKENAFESEEKVTFRRGKRQVSLFKSPNLIEVKMRNGTVVDGLASRLPDALDLPPTTRFVQQYPGRDSAVFYCRREQRDEAMKQLRGSDKVLYCSHVLQRVPDEDEPLADIGVDDKFFVEFKKKPEKKHLGAIEENCGARAIWQAEGRRVVGEIVQDGDGELRFSSPKIPFSQPTVCTLLGHLTPITTPAGDRPDGLEDVEDTEKAGS